MAPQPVRRRLAIRHQKSAARLGERKCIGADRILNRKTGDIILPEQINTIIADERADLCALARPHLNNPFFTRQAAGHYGVRKVGGKKMDWPAQLASGEYQLYREAEKANEKANSAGRKSGRRFFASSGAQEKTRSSGNQTSSSDDVDLAIKARPERRHYERAE